MTSPSPRAQRVFPLHMTPLERYMCSDDRPGYPMTFFVVLDFDGLVERETFEAAYAEALARHPLLAAVLRQGKSRRLCWTAADTSGATIHWRGEGQPLDFADGLAIDLTRENGVRVWSQPVADGTRATFQFHHACTDGIGAYRFIGDLLAAYGIRTAGAGTPPRLSPIDPKLLRDRRKCLVTAIADGKYTTGTLFSLREGYALLAPRVAPVAAPSENDAAKLPSSWPPLSSYTLARQEHDQLRAAADRQQCTMNDLLLCALFRTIHRWNTQHDRPGGQLRILMPTDMRRQEDYEIPAANLSSHALLTRDFAACDRPAQLLAGIRDETSRIKFERRGTRFSDMVSGALKIPGLMPLVCRLDPCLCTAVLSNAGDPTKRFQSWLPREGGRVVAGNLALRRVIGAPPIRRKTRVSMSIFTYMRELTLSASCDPYTFTPADSARFLSLYVALLREHLPAAAIKEDQPLPELSLEKRDPARGAIGQPAPEPLVEATGQG